MRALRWAVAAAAWLWLAPAAHALPRAVIVSGPPATTTATEATFTFTQSERGGLFPRFECRLDGAGWASCASPHKVGNLTGGGHAFEVRLTGLFTDPTPATAGWTVAAATVATPPPIAPSGRPPAPARRDYAGCRDAAARRDQVTAKVMATATLCLVNHERRKRGLRRVKTDRRLATAARRHAADMVARRFFAHVSPDGTGVVRRVARTGYLRGVRFWALGEVLAWTTSGHSSARVAVRALMRSRPHRRVILESTYRHAGVGVIKRAPVPGARGGATFVVNFGRVGR